MTSSDERITQLETELAALRARLEQITEARPEPSGRSRRDLLRLAALGTGAAVVGAVAGASPASAAGSGGVTAGSTNNWADTQTGIVHNGNVQNGPAINAVRTTANTTGVMFSENAGLIAQSEIDGNDAIIGFGPRGATASGVHGFAFDGRAVAGSGDQGVGVFGEIRQGNSGPDTIAVQAVNNCTGPNAVGLKASATGGTAGLGGSFDGTLAPLRLVPASTPGAPQTGLHSVGELYVDSRGNLYFCKKDGTPGAWTRLTASPPVLFHPVAPARVYDSRVAQPSPGKLSSGSNRTVRVADGRSIETGAITVRDLLPVGATAIAYNFTVTNTVDSGFLTMNPGGVTTVTSSAITWSATGQILTTGSVVAVDASRQVTVIAGGVGATDFLIDLVGYYH
jgi:hypothetical protein